jgi:hypothetical protein
MAAETGQSEEELWTEANEIMQNMAHSFGLTSTKAVGYLVLKCLMVSFSISTIFTHLKPS